MKHKNKNLLFLLLIALVVLTFYFSFELVKEMNTEVFRVELTKYIEALGSAGIIIIFLLQILQIIVAFLPGGPYEVIAGMLYGPWISIIILILASIFASIVIFIICKKYGRPFVLKFFKEKHIKEWDWLKDSNKLELITFIIYLIPGTPKDFLIYLMATTSIDTKKFILISNSARIPAMFVSCSLGASITSGNCQMIIIYTVALLIFTIFSFFYRDNILAIFKRMHNKNS